MAPVPFTNQLLFRKNWLSPWWHWRFAKHPGRRVSLRIDAFKCIVVNNFEGMIVIFAGSSNENFVIFFNFPIRSIAVL